MSLKEALARLKAETKVLQNRKNVVTRLNELVRKLDKIVTNLRGGGIADPVLEFDGILCEWDLEEEGSDGDPLCLAYGLVCPYLRIHVEDNRFDFAKHENVRPAHSTPHETAAELLIEVLEKNLEKVVDTDTASG